MTNPSGDLNVGGMALGFGAAAFIVILLMWIGSGMYHGGGMYNGGGMMGSTWSNGVMGVIGPAVIAVAVAAILGALVAAVHNTIARKQ